MACRRETMEAQSQAGSSDRIRNGDLSADVFDGGAGVQAVQLREKKMRVNGGACALRLKKEGATDQPPTKMRYLPVQPQPTGSIRDFDGDFQLGVAVLPRQELLAHWVPAHDSYCAVFCGKQAVVISEKITRREWFVEVGRCGKATAWKPSLV